MVRASSARPVGSTQPEAAPVHSTPGMVLLRVQAGLRLIKTTPTPCCFPTAFLTAEVAAPVSLSPPSSSWMQASCLGHRQVHTMQRLPAAGTGW